MELRDTLRAEEKREDWRKGVDKASKAPQKDSESEGSATMVVEVH